MRARGEEGGRDWYRFLRGDKHSTDINIDEIVIDQKTMKDKGCIKVEIEKFWKNICNSGKNRELNPTLILPR